MTDVGFVIAAYGVVFASLGLYVASIWRRSRRAREASLRIRRGAEGALPPPRSVGTVDVHDEGARRT